MNEFGIKQQEHRRASRRGMIVHHWQGLSKKIVSFVQCLNRLWYKEAGRTIQKYKSESDGASKMTAMDSYWMLLERMASGEANGKVISYDLIERCHIKRPHMKRSRAERSRVQTAIAARQYNWQTQKVLAQTVAGSLKLGVLGKGRYNSKID